MSQDQVNDCRPRRGRPQRLTDNRLFPRGHRRRNGLTVFTLFLATLFFWGCAVPGREQEPEQELEQESEQSLKPHAIHHHDDSIKVDDATILVGGNTYQDKAPITANSGLLAIVKGDAAYLYHPALGDAPLTHETSRRAIGAFVSGVVAERALRSAALDGDYERTGTGLHVRRSGAQDYQFENPTKRMHAVVTSSSDNGSVLFLTAKDFSHLDWNVVLEGDWASFELQHQPTAVVDAASSDVQLHGSLVRRINADAVVTDPAELTASVVWEHARSKRIYFPPDAKEKLDAAISAGADVDVFARLHALELLFLTVAATQQALHVTSAGSCLGASAGRLLTPLIDLLYAITAEDFESWDADGSGAAFDEGVAGLISCGVEAAGDRASADPTLHIEEVVRVIVKIVLHMAWVVDENAVAAHDVHGYHAYDTLPRIAAAPVPAPRWQPGTTFRDCRECPLMVVVPAGKFVMGSPSTEPERGDDEGPQRTVTIAHRFAVGVHEVTFAEWDACAADGGCNNYLPSDHGWGRGTRPVVDVDWRDAQAYVKWLSGKTGNSYRLPSEAEWEYAGRSGSTTPYHYGSTISAEQANYRADILAREKTLPAGTFPANGFGLHDVHGNVFEWTQDCWNASYAGAPDDGSAWDPGYCDRVLRGGSWAAFAEWLRSAYRHRSNPGVRANDCGFRVARTLDS